MTRWITVVLALTLGLGLVACGDDSPLDAAKNLANDKVVKGLEGQLGKIDLSALKEKVAALTGDKKSSATSALKDVESHYETAKAAISKLTGGAEGKWDELLKKAKDALSGLTSAHDKLKGLLG